MSDKISVAREPDESESLESKVRSAINRKPLTSKDLLAKLNLDWSVKKLTNFLNELEFVEVVK